MEHLFQTFAELCDLLAATPGRLNKRAAIAAYLQRLSSRATEDAGHAALYLTGAPFPETDTRKLNVGGALLLRAVRTLAGASDAAMSAAYRKHGDLGAAAFELLSSRTDPSLTLANAAAALSQIASIGNVKARELAVLQLLQRGTPVEVKYLVKLMLGDMRTGVKQSLVEEAVAVAAAVPLADLRHALMLSGNLPEVAALAFGHNLASAHMRLFHPLGFMLASPVATSEEAVARFASGLDASAEESATDDGAAKESEAIPPFAKNPIHALLEDKFDGMRVQLHCGDPAQPGRVALFSRNRENVTESFPEIAEAFARVAEPLILDGELLAWDVAAARALPFTVLSQRLGRKRVSDAMRAATPVVFMAFDVLFAKNALQLGQPLRERRLLLLDVAERAIPLAQSGFASAPPVSAQSLLFDADTLHAQHELARPGLVQRLLLSSSRLVESAAEIDRAYADARDRGNEGVMIKAAGSIYQPGRRGIAWVKLKRELATLDVVVTAAEFGHGRRAGVLSDYTFAVRDGDKLVNVGKAYSGLTDAEIDQLTAWFKEHTLEDHGHIRDVEPSIMLEVAFNNVMRSARHASGFALRFPRILRIRDDKPLSEIDTIDRVEEIYQSQPDKPAE